MKTVYFILGMHRSGTSALGGVINLMGLDFGSNLMQANKFNPKGYFENNFVNQLNEKIFAQHGTSWDDIYFDINKIEKDKMYLYISEVEDILKEEFKYSENCVIKDPRISILFPIWEQACLNLGYTIRVILPYRNPLEVAMSLKNRDGFSLEKGLLLWVHHVLQAELHSQKYKRISLTFNHLIKNPKKTLEKLYRFIKLPEEKEVFEDVALFIDKNIKHKNIALKNFSKQSPEFLRNLVELMEKNDFNNKKKFNHIRDAFYFSRDIFLYDEEKNKVNDYALLEARVKELEHTNTLLDKIKDVTILDIEYYRQRYEDLQDFDENALQMHYVSNGNSEGRFPNAYAEMMGMDMLTKLPTQALLLQKDQILQTRGEEINLLRIQKQEIDKQCISKVTLTKKLSSENKDLRKKSIQSQTKLEKSTKLLHRVEKEKKDLKKSLNKQQQTIKSIEDKLNKTVSNVIFLEKIKKELEETLEKYEDNYLQLLKDYHQLEKELENKTILLEELQIQKEELERLSQLQTQEIKQLQKNTVILEEQLKNINKEKKSLEEALLSQKEVNSKSSTENTDIKKQLLQKSEDLEQKNVLIQELQAHKNELEQNYEKRVKEIQELNTNIDAIVEDLLSLKESKCWVYTKPLRDFQKVMKGKDV